MEVGGSVNTFANDGSFMEMFRKKMEEEKQRSGSSASQAGRSASAVAGDSSPSPPQRALGQDSKVTLPEHPLTGKLAAEPAGGVHDSPPHSARSETEQPGLGESVSAPQAGTTTVASEEDPTSDPTSSAASVPKPKKYSLLSHVGKRRDGKLSLKTGTVKKQRTSDTKATKDRDPWSKYMAEVEMYKAHVCGDEDKSRPLVK